MIVSLSIYPGLACKNVLTKVIDFVSTLSSAFVHTTGVGKM